MKPALQATWPVGNTSHHRLRGSPLSAWARTHMSGSGLGDQVARNLWLRNVPMQSWYSGGLVGKGSEVSASRGPRERGTEKLKSTAPGHT